MVAHRDELIDELKKYFELKRQKKFSKGDMILHQGDKVEHIYFVDSGYIRAYDIDSKGNQKLAMIMGKVNLFPSTAIIQDEFNACYYWQAMTDVVLSQVGIEEFKNELIISSALSYELFTYVAKELAILDGRVRTLLQTYAAQRIPSTIKHLVDYAGHIDTKGIGHLEVVISHQDVAALTNVARETASIELKKMKDNNIIWYEGHKMLIDLSKLEDMV